MEHESMEDPAIQANSFSCNAIADQRYSGSSGNVILFIQSFVLSSYCTMKIFAQGDYISCTSEFCRQNGFHSSKLYKEGS
jgi:hypothetical protein